MPETAREAYAKQVAADKKEKARQEAAKKKPAEQPASPSSNQN